MHAANDTTLSTAPPLKTSNSNNNNTLSSINSPSTHHSSSVSHMNYYYLNAKGKQAIKRILCVYEYHYPQVTYNPGLVSVSSLLLHYMQEHEVFAALCFMSSTKEHLIESKASWDTACSVFTRLLKSYCVKHKIWYYHEYWFYQIEDTWSGLGDFLWGLEDEEIQNL